MGQRRDLNTSLTPAERTTLVNLMLQYLTDAVVNAHVTITHSGLHLFTGHDAYIADMEAYLQSRGAGLFVPLPKWDPSKPIPPEFNVVKAQDNGTPRPPLGNLNPNMPLPAQYATPALCNFPSGDALGDDINGWHGAVHGAIGGTMGSFAIASAAPIFWCWHGFVGDVYYDYQRCDAVRGWAAPAAVPGWFGWENQGGGVAVADLSGNGRPDLVVFHIDNPRGENRGYYRIGRDLDRQGNVAGGWTNPLPVPGWFGAENQGGDVAVADVTGNGRPDLVVFHIDNPPGENQGYYRIGRDLDANGNVAGGWTNPLPVPGWFGYENQGAGIAVADILGNGRPDLLVFHIDNPRGDNRGYYRIGWDLDNQGNVTGGWSAILPVPGWFGWENQGAGVALVDIHGHGQRDLVVFSIDNPSGDNRGYYRVGWHLGANGLVSHGWSNPIAVPGWFGWENQGGGVAVADISGNGRPDLCAFSIDNPPGDNRGYYRIGWNLDTNGVVS